MGMDGYKVPEDWLRLGGAVVTFEGTVCSVAYLSSGILVHTEMDGLIPLKPNLSLLFGTVRRSHQ